MPTNTVPPTTDPHDPEIARLRAALNAVIAQCKRDDCSQAMLLTHCHMEAERGLDGRVPLLQEAIRG